MTAATFPAQGQRRRTHPLLAAGLLPGQPGRAGSGGGRVSQISEVPGPRFWCRRSFGAPSRSPRRSASPAPTAEQVDVIEAPLAPLLVVAGAGSGKTETMAARVVWLVANGHVRPEEVLGPHFTRKAAGELADGPPPAAAAALDGSVGAADAATRRRRAGDVTVSTYHSYAGRLVREHGLRLGVEPGAAAQRGGRLAARARGRAAWDGDVTSPRPRRPSPRPCSPSPASAPSTWSTPRSRPGSTRRSRRSRPLP